MDSKKQFVDLASVQIDSNISETGVQITDSKAKLIYRDFISPKISVTVFSITLSVFCSFLISLLTSSFSDINDWGGSGLIIKGIFCSICALAGIAALVSAIFILKNRKKYTENEFIRALHKSSATYDSSRIE